MISATDGVPLRRVLLQCSAGGDLSATVAAWLRKDPPLVLHAGQSLSSDAGPVLALSCHPTPAGFLHAETRVLVAPPCAPPPPPGPGAGPLVRLAAYVGRLLLPSAPAALLLAFLCAWSAARRWGRPRRLGVVSVAELLRRASGAGCDPQAAVLVAACVARQLAAPCGQWHACEVRAGAARRRIHLQVLSGHVERDVALIACPLWWSLTLPDGAPATLHLGHSAPPPLARSVRLAQLAGPTQMALESCRAALSDHFCRPRLLLPGHVVVASREHPDTGRPRHAFFRVESVEPAEADCDVTAGVLASCQVTSLYQVSDVVGAVPPLEPIVDTAWEPGQLPAGLEPEWRQLCRLLSPPATGDRPLVAVCGGAGSGLDRLVAAAAGALGHHLVTLDCGLLVADSSGATAGRVRQQLARGHRWRCLLHLNNAHLLGRDRDTASTDQRVVAALLEAAAALPAHTLLLLSTPAADQLVAGLRGHVTHELQLPAPDVSRREAMLGWTARRHRLDLSWLRPGRLALHAAGFTLGDLDAVITQAKCSALARLEAWCGHCHQPPPARPPTLCLDFQDVQVGLAFVRARLAETVGAPQIPDTRWQDVGGLEAVKREVVDLIQLPIAHPELFADGTGRSGILLYGPPGTGKTLVAKAVATECGLNFLSVKGPELINMYVGQSEANVRDVFSRARDASPSVIFFDELDSLAPNRGRTGDSGGVMDRVVSQFLAELDGAVTSGQLFVIGATNRPDLIDPALLRPGRFDRLLFLGPSRCRQSHLAILRAQTRRLHLSDDVSLESVVERLPQTLTGADVYAVCERATRGALDRAVDMVESGEATEESAPILVTQQDLLEAADMLVPSLTPDQLHEYEVLRQRIEGAA